LLPDGKVDGVALALQRVEEVTVAEDFRVSIPEKVRRRLGIKAGDRLRVRVERGAIIFEPVKPREALERLASIADRLLGGPQRVDAVKLIERSLKREAGLH
jgi:AbrB family looped-hinge helix DNA binding protein